MLGIKIPFSVEGKQYRRGLEGLKKETKGWSKGIKSQILGAFAVGAVLGGLRSWFKEMDRIHKLSKRLNVSIGGLQKLGVAADLNGANLEQVAKALTKFSYNAQQARDGSKSLQQSFERLGIDTRELANLDAPEQMVELSRAFLKAEKNGSGMADVMRVMGGKAAELIPMLREGPEVLRDLFGGTDVISDGTVKSIAAMNDAITKLTHNLKVGLAKAVEWYRIGFSAIGRLGGAVAAGILNDASIDEAWGYIKDARSELEKDMAEIRGETVNGERDAANRSAEYWEESAERSAEAHKKSLEEKKKESEKFRNFLINDHAVKAEKAREFIEQRRFQDLSPVEKIQELQNKRAKLTANAMTTSDINEKTIAMAEIIKIEDQLAEFRKVLKDEGQERQAVLDNAKIRNKEEEKENTLKVNNQSPAAGIIASSLAQIGGGGGVFVGRQDPALDEARKQSSTLNSIEQGIAMLNRTMTSKTTTPTTFKK